MKIKKLIAVGCSHVYGAETIPDDSNHPDSKNYSFAKHLADNFKCEYVNIACCGISNFEIARRLQQYIDFFNKDTQELFVMIGWTDYNRFTISIEDELKKKLPNLFSPRLMNISSVEIYAQKMISLMQNPFKEEPIYLKQIKKIENGEQFYNFVNKNIFDTQYFTDLNYLLRTTMTNYLLAKNINHLTIPTTRANRYINTQRYENVLDNNHNILEHKHNFDYINDFSKYGVEPGYHLSRKAHEEVAKFLLSKIALGMGFIKQ